MTQKRKLLSLLVLSVSVSFSVPALGYDQDTHHYFTFYLALTAGCFDWWESWVIASANWSQDLNETTISEKNVLEVAKGMLGMTPDVPHQRNWHAFVESGREAEREKRLQELWDRVTGAADKGKQLVYLGQLLHFVQDALAHDGYEPGLGHGLATIFGNDPDALHNKQREISMVKATVGWLFRECDRRGRAHGQIGDVEEQMGPLLDRLVPSRTSGWRFSSRQADLAHMLENVRLLGWALEENETRAMPHCWASTAIHGGNERARHKRLIPSPIRIEYNKGGEPTNLPAVSGYIDAIKNAVEKCDESSVEQLYRKIAQPAQPISLREPAGAEMPVYLSMLLSFAIMLIMALIV